MDMTVEIDLKKYKDYSYELDLLLILSGFFPNYKKKLETFIRFYISLSICIIICSVSAFCYKFAANINLLIRAVGIIMSFSTGLVKIITFSVYQNDLSRLDNGVSARFTSDLEIPENRIHLLANFPIIYRFFYILNYAATTVCSTFVLVPLIFLHNGKYLRSYPVVLPFTYEQGGPVHWIVYSFEVITTFGFWSITCSADSSFGRYVLHIIGELRLLSINFRELKSGKNYKDDLKNCVDRHCMLVKAKNTLERIFGLLSIDIAVTCAVAICPLLYQVSKTKHFTILKIFHITSYIMVKLMQAYSYAWFGNIIAVESQACLDSIYESFWQGTGDIHFMNDVLIILSQKPFFFKAKGIMFLDMTMFAKTVSTSVSYFFLIQTLDQVK